MKTPKQGKPQETCIVFTIRERGAGKIAAMKAEIERAKEQGKRIECDPRRGWRWVKEGVRDESK